MADPRLVMGLLNASPRLIQLFQNLIDKRGYDAGLMAENIMPKFSNSWSANHLSNGEYLKIFDPEFNPNAYPLQNTQAYLKDISNNTIANEFKNISRAGPTEDQLAMYAGRPDLLEKYYGGRNDIYAMAMKLGARDYANEHDIFLNSETSNPEYEYYHDDYYDEFMPDDSNITDGSPFGIDDFLGDDNPDNELSKLAKKLLGGGGYIKY